MRTCLKNVIYLLFLGIIFSCSSDYVIVDEEIEVTCSAESRQMFSSGVVYPLRNGGVNTLPGSFEANWENYEEITLASGNTVLTPWEKDASISFPVEIARDINREDGWELIVHTLSPKVDNGLNYLIFHNYVTGVLKVFYYLEKDRTNNTGVWQIEFEDLNSKFLNFENPIADPLTYGGDKNIVNVSNLSDYEFKSFTLGWNCFQVELAYDPNFTDGYMKITAYNMNIQNLDLVSKYEETSTGVLLVESTSNKVRPLIKGLANFAGNGAKKWVDKKIKEGSVKDTLAETRFISAAVKAKILAGGAKEIVKFGVNNVFNSFTGRFNKTKVKEHDIRLKTEGTMEIDGTIDFSSSAPVLPFVFSCSVEDVGPLGAWNLSAPPTLYVSPIGKYVNTAFGKEHFYQSEGLSGLNYSLAMNPKLRNALTNQKIDIQLIRYLKNSPTLPDSYANFDGGELGTGHYGGHNVTLGKVIYQDEDTEILTQHVDPTILTYEDRDLYDAGGRLSPYVFIPRVPYYVEKIALNSENTFLRFSPQLAVSIEGKTDTIAFTKTFYPRYEWDPNLYKKFKDIPHEYIEYMK